MTSTSKNSRQDWQHFYDYDANIVSLVPCLVEETVKEMFDTTMDMATDKEIEKAKEYVMKR